MGPGLFFLISIGLLIFLDKSEFLFWPQLAIWVVYILFVVRSMLGDKYFYLSTLLAVQSIVFVFFTYIYQNQENVERITVFVFSAFTKENLEIASRASLFAVIPIVLVYFFQKKAEPQSSSMNQNIVEVIVGLLSRLSRISNKDGFLLLILSFSISFILFLTNVSIFEVSYPFNAHSLWVSPIYFVAFYALIFLPYLVFLAKRLTWPKASAKKLLTLSRINLIISPTLLLLIYSSRGLMAVAFFLVGSLEILLSAKKKGAWLFGVLCLLISLYLVQSFPYLRFQLAHSLESNSVVFAQSVERMIPFRGLDAHVGGDHLEVNRSINLNDYPMIGQSLFHMLYVVDLVKQANTLDGITFINLISQATPQVIAGWLGYERPLNDNWRLGLYYRHMGGFLAIANAYWNGGVWVMTIFMVVLSSVVMAIDRYFAKGNRKIIAVLGYWSLLPIFAVQLAYGIQGLVRVLQLVGLLILFDKFRFLNKKS